MILQPLLDLSQLGNDVFFVLDRGVKTCNDSKRTCRARREDIEATDQAQTLPRSGGQGIMRSESRALATLWKPILAHFGPIRYLQPRLHKVTPQNRILGTYLEVDAHQPARGAVSQFVNASSHLWKSPGTGLSAFMKHLIMPLYEQTNHNADRGETTC